MTDNWWECPRCGGDTQIDDNVRSCEDCSWKFEIPIQKESLIEIRTKRLRGMVMTREITIGRLKYKFSRTEGVRRIEYEH